MSGISTPQTVIIGIGNANRGDDASGLIIAQRLQEKVDENVTVRAVSGDCTQLLDAWTATDAVIVIDATHSGASPGTIHRIDAVAQAVPPLLGCYSTHAFGVAEAIELARVLQRLPAHLIVYGVEGKNYGVGTLMSAEVTEAIDKVVAHILHDVHCWQQRAKDHQDA